jgi:DNA-binding NtrC family response regulator
MLGQRIALFGQPADEGLVRSMLQAAGAQVRGYGALLNEAELRRAELVVVDHLNHAAQNPSDWRILQGICRQKPVLMFSHSEVHRLEALRWGAYFVGEAARSPADVALLVQRARSRKVAAAVNPARRLLVGESAAMQAQWRALQRLADSPSMHVVLRGEPGVGKRTFARALHLAGKQEGSFREVFEPKRLEEQISTSLPGTVYLADLAAFSEASQSKLSRLLRTARPGLRFVGSLRVSGRHVQEARPGLLDAFGVSLDVPPLRARSEDLPLLTTALLSRASAARGTPAPKLDADTLEVLSHQSWPGNVRQLENLLQRSLLLADEGSLDESVLSALNSLPKTGYRLPEGGVDLQELERDALTQALQRANGNRTRAASLLRLSRDQVRYRLAKFGDSETEDRVA